MAQRVVLVGFVLALGVGGWWLLRDDDATPGVQPEDSASVGDAMPMELSAREVVPPAAAPAPSDAEPTALDVPAAPTAAAADTATDASDDALPEFDPVPDARVAGHVLSTDGAPLPDARVLLFEHAWRDRDGRRSWGEDLVAETRADEQGAFAFDALPGKFRVSAEHPGWACAERVEGEAERELDAQELEILMAPAVDATGFVRDARGAPVNGARLTLRPATVAGFEEHRLIYAAKVFSAEPASVETRSDAAGAFEFPPVVGGTMRLTAHHDEHPTLTREVEVDGRVLDIVLDDGATLAGIVYDSEGEPLPGTEVRLRGARVFDNDVEPREAVTGDDGAFTLRGLTPSESAYVILIAEGHAVHVVQPQPIAADRTTVVEYDLVAESAISGVLRDVDGRPLEGFGVKAQGERVIELGASFHPIPTWEQRSGVSSTETDTEGRFHLGQLYAGEFQLGIYREGELLRTASVVSGGDELELMIDTESLGGVSFHGRVTDSDTGLPVPHFEVFVWKPNFSGSFSGRPREFADVEGRYAIEALNPGVMSLSASADGYHGGSSPRREYDAGEHLLDLSVSPHRELQLRVIRPSGEPVAECRASFHHASMERADQMLMIPTGPNTRGGMLTTDDDGRLHAYELPAEPIRVSLRTDWENEPQVLEYDLSRPVVGLQTVVLDEELTARATKRDVNVMLLALAEDRPDDLVTIDPAEIVATQASLMAQFTSGKLGFVGREVTLTFTSAAGDDVRHASYGKNEAGEWSLTADMSWSTFNRPGYLSWSVPVGAGTLTLDIEGKGVRTIALPEGEDELHAMLWFDEI